MNFHWQILVRGDFDNYYKNMREFFFHNNQAGGDFGILHNKPW